MIGRIVRWLFFGLGLLFASPLILFTRIEAGVSGGRSLRIFGQCKEILAAIPTLVGDYLRGAFYWAVIPGVSHGVLFSYGSMVSRRDASILPGAVIGVHSIIGSANIGRDVLISARVSILSGKYQHGRPGERTSVHDDHILSHVSIGDNTWIGENALVLANIGRNCTVGAGSVVYKDVPDDTTVLGNPARKVSL